MMLSRDLKFTDKEATTLSGVIFLTIAFSAGKEMMKSWGLMGLITSMEIKATTLFMAAMEMTRLEVATDMTFYMARVVTI
jgi:hypothetical protein